MLFKMLPISLLHSRSSNSLDLQNGAAHPAADSRDVLKTGQERLEQETWSGAGKRQKESCFLIILLRALMLLKAPDTFTL